MAAVIPLYRVNLSGIGDGSPGAARTEQTVLALLWAIPAVAAYRGYESSGLAGAAVQGALGLVAAFALGWGGIGSPLMTAGVGAWLAGPDHRLAGAAIGGVTPFALAALA